MQIKVTNNLLEKIKQDIKNTTNTMSRRSVGNIQEIIEDVNSNMVNHRISTYLGVF